MPTISSSSAIRTSSDHFSLVLRTRHFLVAGAASENVRIIKGRLPADVDVILASDLVIALSGMVDAVKIPGHVMQQSAVARHILEYLKANTDQLGVRLASNIYVDQEDDRAKFSLSSSRPLRAVTEMACLRLVSIDAELVCKTSSRGERTSSQAASLFSGQEYLPLFSALDGVMDKFVSNDLVRKYPLIFGPWRERSDAEARLYPSLSCSLLNVVKSSNDPSIKRRLRRVMTTLRGYRTGHVARAMQSFHTCLGDGADEDEIALGNTTMDDHALVSYALDILYRLGVRPAVFKPLSRTSRAAPQDVDEDAQMFDLSARPSRRAATDIQKDSDDEGTMLFGTNTEDEDFLVLSDDQRGSASWSALESIIHTKDTVPAEDDQTCIDLWDEGAWDEGAVVYYSPSVGLFCDAPCSSTQRTLSDLVDSEDEACWSSPRSITVPSQARPRSSQQSSEADDGATIIHKTGHGVWSPPALTHRHTVWNADVHPHAPPDLIFKSDNEEFVAEDAMVALSMRCNDQGPSTGQFCCVDSELVGLSADDSLCGNTLGYNKQEDEDALSLCLEPCYGLEPSHLSSRDIIASELGSGDLCGGASGILSDGEW